ncbi:glycosyltransferase family 2 protein [Psychrobacter immobilis]|uniref:glycosyltransferase family 2 protein n=2 Tax=Psychrobacter immobilis TaxID=498 RepID=UPI00191A4A55|nr:glycosyltransferase family 2 protein [Psychrobacter immobilis]
MTIQRQQGGSQRDWNEVRNHSTQPVITIITSTYNVVQDLQWTIDSIREQTYPNIQWIIADGASTDGTVEMLKEHSDLIDYWFSESDTGIYDAWNKALEHVTGDWVQFIGAGDELFETNTLEKVAYYLKDAYPEYELVYGQVMHISEKGRKELYVSGEPWEKYKGKWEIGRPKLPSHPAVYHHNSLFLNDKFNSDFKIVADSLLLLNYINNPFLYIPIIIDKMPNGGISSSPIGSVKCYEELLKANKLLNIKVPYKVRVKSRLRYFFTKSSLFFLTEEQYGKFMDITKIIRRKPKVFTLE